MTTAHKTDEEKQEFFDTADELEKKVSQLAEWVKSSKHFIVFTGAGVSTSAGIPDFRSGVNTVLQTGPGCWERKATGTTVKPKKEVDMNQAVPTPCHMALCELEKAGYLKFLISQNVDGLHRRSGFPIDKMAELHGNDNLEICKAKDCGKQYMRDYSTRNARGVFDHATGRGCESCGGMLYDTIINFGENLPIKALEEGFNHGKEADLCLVLGSSLRVTPAAKMPLETARKGKLVIVNLQATPLDEYAFRINGMIDDVIGLLMKKLNLQIPPFRLVRRCSIKRVPAPEEESKKGLLSFLKSTKSEEKESLMIRGVDSNGDPYSLFPQIEATFLETGEKIILDKEPFIITPKKSSLKEGKLRVVLHWQGYYGEKPLQTSFNLSDISTTKAMVMTMTFDPIETGKWLSITLD